MFQRYLINIYRISNVSELTGSFQEYNYYLILIQGINNEKHRLNRKFKYTIYPYLTAYCCIYAFHRQ